MVGAVGCVVAAGGVAYWINEHIDIIAGRKRCEAEKEKGDDDHGELTKCSEPSGVLL